MVITDGGGAVLVGVVLAPEPGLGLGPAPAPIVGLDVGTPLEVGADAVCGGLLTLVGGGWGKVGRGCGLGRGGCEVPLGGCVLGDVRPVVTGRDGVWPVAGGVPRRSLALGVRWCVAGGTAVEDLGRRTTTWAERRAGTGALRVRPPRGMGRLA